MAFLKKDVTSNNNMSKRQLTIGSKIFVVHKDYAYKKKPGGKVLSARIIGFENIKNVIVPIFKVSYLESNVNSNQNSYEYFYEIEEALKAIIS